MAEKPIEPKAVAFLRLLDALGVNLTDANPVRAVNRELEDLRELLIWQLFWLLPQLDLSIEEWGVLRAWSRVQVLQTFEAEEKALIDTGLDGDAFEEAVNAVLLKTRDLTHQSVPDRLRSVEARLEVWFSEREEAGQNVVAALEGVRERLAGLEQQVRQLVPPDERAKEVDG